LADWNQLVSDVRTVSAHRKPHSAPGSQDLVATLDRVSADVESWFLANTSTWCDQGLGDLLSAKERTGTTVSLVVPARNEAATVGDVVSRVREALVETTDLLDEIVVIDSDSTDDTYAVASDAGATVHRSAEIRPDLGSHPGKGEAMWKSLFVTRGDVIVFMDADLLDWDTHFVPGLLGPLLTRPEVALVKGFYERPLADGTLEDDVAAYEGGRVTELVARPLLNLLYPALAGLVQPLAGEWAIRRDLFASLRVPTGYAVELTALIDTVGTRGIGAIAQVDLGRRAHRHQALRDLGGMSTQILAAALDRTGLQAPGDATVLRQYHRVGGAVEAVDRLVPEVQRPPAAGFLS